MVNSESQELIDSLSAQFKKLLTDHWLELWNYGDKQKGAKGAIAFSIGCQKPSGYKLSSKVSFGIRITHKTEDLFDPAQLELKGLERNGQKKAALRRS